MMRLAPPAPLESGNPPGPPPREGMAWVPGRWVLRGPRYYWRRGRWVRPPAPGALWIPGYWDRRGPNYVWVPGYWHYPGR